VTWTLRLTILLLLLCAMSAHADLRRWTVADDAGFAPAVKQGVQVHPDSLVILAALDGTQNLALGRTVVDQFSRSVPLADGSIALVGSEWISGTPNVFGFTFTVDLGVDRAIDRVRILAGETALSQREYFIRGYELDAAREANRQVWRRLAQNQENLRLNIDTNRDSTWVQRRDDGTARPVEGRFVRLRLTRQDRSNWVAIGEIEVYGRGYTDEGAIEDALDLAAPVNVGRLRWLADTATGTTVKVRARGDGEAGDLPAWDLVAPLGVQESLFDAAEPVRRLEYRVDLTSDDPWTTPALRRLQIDYDDVLVAGDVRGQVSEPEDVVKGEPAALVYRVDVDVNASHHGIDRLRLRGAAVEVADVRVDGRSLAATDGFRSEAVRESDETIVDLGTDERIATMATVEIEGTALFLQDRTAVRVDAGSSTQSERDGYTNWQNGREADTGSWTVLASGDPLDLLGPVSVTPRPYSPYAGQDLRLETVVSNIEEGRRISLEIFSLDGHRVQRMSETGRSRAYAFEWDGRDSDGGVVRPGLYLYEVRVSDSGAARRGTIVVAY
jgi:hypothetical protein